MWLYWVEIVALFIVYLSLGWIQIDRSNLHYWKWWQVVLMLPFWLPLSMLATLFGSKEAE